VNDIIHITFYSTHVLYLSYLFYLLLKIKLFEETMTKVFLYMYFKYSR